MQELCENAENSTYERRSNFPSLEPITIREVQTLAASISRKKALATDMVEDTTLLDAIETSEETAKMFTKLWDESVTNLNSFRQKLTGRLIPLNKVHPQVPDRTQMRPIICLSPIVKLAEARFKNKLDNYMTSRMNICQTGFVRNCGTHVNIVRLLKESFEKRGAIAKVRSYLSTLSLPITTSTWSNYSASSTKSIFWKKRR